MAQSPDLFTTSDYLEDAVNEFGRTSYHNIRHRLATMTLEATDDIPTPHVLEATVTVPITRDGQDGTARVAGPRRLEINLMKDETSGDERIVSTGYESTLYLTGNTKDLVKYHRLTDAGNAHAYPGLASTTIKFSWERVTDAYGDCFDDGALLGLEQHNFATGSRDNFLLSYLANLNGRRAVSVQTAASWVAKNSFMNGTSTEEISSFFDVSEAARAIERKTGVPKPKSLAGSQPYIDRGVWARIGPNIVTQGEDDFDFVGAKYSYLIRGMGDYSITFSELEYAGKSPVEIDGDNTDTLYDFDDPTYDFNIYKQSYGSDAKEYVESDDEVRALIQPVIRAVSNLRRYRNRALAK